MNKQEELNAKALARFNRRQQRLCACGDSAIDHFRFECAASWEEHIHPDNAAIEAIVADMYLAAKAA